MNKKLFKGYRTYRFEASHCEKLPLTTMGIRDQENAFGRNLFPHGHNYKIVLGILGSKNPRTSMIVELGALDAIIKAEIIDRFDHQDLNHLFYEVYDKNFEKNDTVGALVEYNTNFAITLEWFTQHCYSLLEKYPVTLDILNEIAIYDGKQVGVLIRKGMKNMLYRSHIFNFSAIHALSNVELTEAENWEAFGKCTREHGHDYILKVILKGTPNKTTNKLVVDQKFKKAVKEVLKKYDYTVLHNHYELAGKVITTEVLVEHLWKEIEPVVEGFNMECIYSASDLQLHALSLQETARNTFIYTGPNQELSVL